MASGNKMATLAAAIRPEAVSHRHLSIQSLPMSSLTWDDLFVDAEHLDFSRLLAEWPGVVTGQIGPIGASAFGDLFFERRSGEVEKLDVLEGGVQLIAPTREEFATLMNAQHWQEQHLSSNGVALLKDRGVLRSAGQFFGFAPHPVFTGKIDWSSVMPLDAIVWNSICAQSLNGAVPSAILETSTEPSKKPWWKLGRE